MAKMGATSVSCQLVILYLFGLCPVSSTSSFTKVVSCKVLAALDDNCHIRLTLKACHATERSSSGNNLSAESRKWTLFDVTIADVENVTSRTLKFEYFCDLQSVDWTRTPALEHTIRDTSSTRSVWKDILCLLAVNYKLPSSRCTFVLDPDRNYVGDKSWPNPENKEHKCINRGRTAEGTSHDATGAKTLATVCALSGGNKSDYLAMEDVQRVKSLDFRVIIENKGLINVKCCGLPSDPGKAMHVPALVQKRSRTVDNQNRVWPPVVQSGREFTTSGLESDLTLDEIGRLNVPWRSNMSDKSTEDLLPMPTTLCPPGSFGPSCNYQCHCINRGSCDRRFGICFEKECALGWMGESCDERQCPPGFYGLGLNQYCTETCLCGNFNDCHVVTGECISGLCFNTSIESLCAEQLCPRRKLDRNRNCEQECFCLNGAVCHPVTGMCPEEHNCAPGFLPPNCTVPTNEMEWYEVSFVRVITIGFVLGICSAKFYYVFMLRLLPKMI